MKIKLLEDLFYNYLSLNKRCSEEEKKLVSTIVKNEEMLLNGLDEEKKQTLEKFLDAINDIQSFLVKEAFIDGVRFSSRFIIEALIE